MKAEIGLRKTLDPQTQGQSWIGVTFYVSLSVFQKKNSVSDYSHFPHDKFQVTIILQTIFVVDLRVQVHAQFHVTSRDP